MTPAQAATILAVAATFDARLRPPTEEDSRLRAQAWSATLDPDMPPEAGQRLVNDHYRNFTDCLMPAHLNQLWRVEKRRNGELFRSDLTRKQIAAASAVAVPMPPNVKHELSKLLGTPHA
jgi:hypothetical protein